VTGWLIAIGARRLRRRFREPELAFLLIQAACFTAVFVLLDRKLGSARDWDIFTPHVAGFCWIAARIWEPEAASQERRAKMPSLRFAAPWAALLIAWPWFAVNASREASVQRFTEIRADFPTFPRAYATEELAKYFRDRGDLNRSLPLYQESVRTYPRNARTRILLGTNYLALKRVPEASEQFDEALRLDPGNWMALDLRAKIALQAKDYALAYELFRKLVPQEEADPDAWGGFGYAAYKEGHLEEALEAFRRASARKPDPQYDYYIGFICASLGRWDEAVAGFERSTRGDQDGDYFHALAMALEAREATRAGGPNPDGLAAAQTAAARAVEIAPKKVLILRYKQHIDAVIAGTDAPLNLLR
jgi:tetratricopeptide (TPR) repeat protein